MFKIIKMELFDSFHCLMDKCPSNCCDEDWLIRIDSETYNRYKSLGINNLDAKITPAEPHSIIKTNHKCPFITNEGLCSLHRDYGEDYLSNTCKSYPRMVSTYGDLYIENIALSCPAAANWIMSLDLPCELLEKVYYEDQNEVGTPFPASNNEQVMKAIVSPFYQCDTFYEALNICLKIIGVTDSSELLTLHYLNAYPILLRNISICFLFENLMLESKKENPDIVNVIARLLRILQLLEAECCKTEESNRILTPQYISDALYKIMRQEDH